MNKYAVININTGEVENIINYDGISNIEIHSFYKLELCNENHLVLYTNYTKKMYPYIYNVLNYEQQ